MRTSDMLISGNSRTLREAVLGIDLKPRTPNAMDDEFDDNSFNTSKWTWLDQGTFTASEANDNLTITAPADGNRMRGIYQTAPAAPWLFQAKIFVPVGGYGSRTMGHLFAGQSTTQEIRTVGLYKDTIRGISYATPSSSATAWGDSVGDDRQIPFPAAIWFQMAFDGTSLVGGYGYAGGFVEMSTVATGYTPTLIGLGVENDGSATARASFGWFRRLA